MRKAFTLAEVLVTLGIIGVISAMTLPTLIKNHQRQTYVTQLQKVVNDLSQMFETIITENNAVSLRESPFWSVADKDILNKYFKVTQNCTGTELDNCFVEQYRNLNGEQIRARNLIYSGSDCVSISSGASICFANDAYRIFVDVNGKQGPNVVGRDFFDMYVEEDGSIVGVSQEDFEGSWSNATTITGNDYGIYLTKIMNDGWKMDY